MTALYKGNDPMNSYDLIRHHPAVTRDQLAPALYEADLDGDGDQFVPWSTLPEHERAGWLETADVVLGLPDFEVTYRGSLIVAGQLHSGHIGRSVRFVWIDPARREISCHLVGRVAGIEHEPGVGSPSSAPTTGISLYATAQPGAKIERYVIPSTADVYLL